MRLVKRLLSGFLAALLICGMVPAFAEEEEELSFDDMVPETQEETAEEFMDWTITDAVQETIEDIDNWEVDTSVNPDDLELRSKSMDSDAGLQHNDVNMILSINTETGSIKLTSILRDMYVTIPGYKNKSRINNAYARGGGQLAMRTINHNFNMNIQYYVTINFYGLASIIESIGGIDVEMTKGEAYAINHYIKEHPPVYDTKDGSERTPLEVVEGTQHLDGIQAVMYARLRTGMKTGNGDFNRTARQRKLLELLLKKIMQDMSMNRLSELITTTLPYVTTNVNGGTILNLAFAVLSSDIISKAHNGEELIAQHRVPMDKTYKYMDVEGSSVINLSSDNWKTNINALHSFIYGE